jgi:hypothetical protein
VAVKVSEMTAILAAAIDAAADYVHIIDSSLGAAGDRKVAPTELVGAARGLTVDANLSGTPQNVEVRGTASALGVATDEVVVTGNLTVSTGDFITSTLTIPSAGGITAADTLEITLAGSGLILTSLPTADPLLAGALWNDGGTVKVSAG